MRCRMSNRYCTADDLDQLAREGSRSQSCRCTNCRAQSCRRSFFTEVGSVSFWSRSNCCCCNLHRRTSGKCTRTQAKLSRLVVASSGFFSSLDLHHAIHPDSFFNTVCVLVTASETHASGSCVNVFVAVGEIFHSRGRWLTATRGLSVRLEDTFRAFCASPRTHGEKEIGGDGVKLRQLCLLCNFLRLRLSFGRPSVIDLMTVIDHV